MEQDQVGTTMILPNIRLTKKINLICEYTGMDSEDQCLSKKHFTEYPYQVSYVHNSRGFRDHEWPESVAELSNSIWCIGDSFTMGVGQPFEHIWPQVLSKRTGMRCINLSLDGASNEWISRRARQIIETVKPKIVVILWSYFNRREHINSSLLDEERRTFSDKCSYDADVKNFIKCISDTNEFVANISTKVINGLIPNASWMVANIEQTWNYIKIKDWPSTVPASVEEFDNLPAFVKDKITKNHELAEQFYTTLDYQRVEKKYQLIELKNLDYARDGHHFDVLTSNFFVDKIQLQLDVNCNN